MSDRYTRLFLLAENLYTPGSPVIIEAGALLKDNQTGQVLAQLKLKNISDRKIASVRVLLTTYDTADRQIGDAVEKQYLDVAAAPDVEFGQKVPLPLPDSTTRSFAAEVSEVVFANKMIWNADAGCVWKAIPRPSEQSAALRDQETRKQYSLENGGCFMAMDYEDLWVCTCGTINREDESCCRKCDRVHAELQNIDMDALAARRDARVAEEKRLAAKQAEAARLAAEKKAEAARLAAKKARKIAVILASVAVAAVAVMLLLTRVIIPAVKYNAAVKQMNAGEYEAAIAAFEAMDGYKDSDAQIDACETAILDEEYEAAVALLDAGEYEDAITAFTAMNGYSESAEQILECRYRQAGEVYDSGSYDEAYALYLDLTGYKDVDTLLKTDDNLLAVAAAYRAEWTTVGNVVTFGAYEQDNNTSNGKEAIEWIVLDADGDDVLVISKCALDVQPYNEERESCTWETCTLRSWLNGTFYNAAFSAEEQSQIQTTTVTADKNQKYSTSAGNNTQDKVFLLSVTEAEKYFSSDTDRQCVPTEYAIAQGAYTSRRDSIGGKATCWWWLRSPGSDSDLAACVDYDGSVSFTGLLVHRGSGCVRPALWIHLDS